MTDLEGTALALELLLLRLGEVAPAQPQVFHQEGGGITNCLVRPAWRRPSRIATPPQTHARLTHRSARPLSAFGHVRHHPSLASRAAGGAAHARHRASRAAVRHGQGERNPADGRRGGGGGSRGGQPGGVRGGV
eukprot:6868580-Prymnesium_polylepis.1